MYRVSRQVVAFLFLGLSVALASDAAVLRDLYSAEVAVADKSQEALAVGSQEALSEVLVKVSGSNAALENPELQSALGRARSLVQQYAYVREDSESGKLWARFEFDQSVISKLVAQAGVPFWTANRPSVLVWVVVDGTQGKMFLNRESSPEMMQKVEEEFNRRGVPVQFPLYDLNDSAAISIDELWQLNAHAVTAASQRYNVQHVLAGRLATLSNGSWVGDWSYLSKNSRVDRSIRVGDAEEFLRAGVSLAALEMSAKYAVAPSATVTEGIKLLVSGVSSYSDYSRIVAWLEGLELIEFANVEQIRGDTIRLNLVAQADAGQLSASIEMNQRLVPVHSTDPPVQLSYQWQK